MFRNATIYRVNNPINTEYLADMLANQLFVPCSGLRPTSAGWIPVLPDDDSLVFEISGFQAITLKLEQKVIPPSAIEDLVSERVSRIEDEEMRTLRSKEKKSIRENVVAELLPAALPSSKVIQGVYSESDQLLIVSTKSNADAERFLNALRNCLGTLQVSPIQSQHKPTDHYTIWLNSHRWPDGFGMGYTCDLLDIEDRSTAKFRHQDLSARELKANVEAGKICTLIGLRWKEITFNVDKNLVLSGIKDETIIEAEEEDKFAAYISHMMICFRKMIPDLLKVVGGEARQTELPMPQPTNDTPTESLENYEQARDLVIENQRASISFVQRNLKIGYNRAARIVEMLEAKGIVSTIDAIGKRQVLKTSVDEE